MTASGGLIVSLDYELNWGYRNEAKPLSTFDVEGTLNNIKALLDQYEIRSTWATVGQLFQNEITSTGDWSPDDLYRQRRWIEANLVSDPKVDLGSHSFNHTFFLETLIEKRKVDFDNMQGIERAFKSIVFPRNQYDPSLLDSANSYNLDCYRGVQSSWYLQSNKLTGENFFLKLCKRFCELLPFDRAVEISQEHELLAISDSRFFRFFPGKTLGNLLTRYYRFLLQKELLWALEQGKYYHIWFHPHNLIVKPQRMKELEIFFQYFHSVKNRYNAKSHHMMDVVGTSA